MALAPAQPRMINAPIQTYVNPLVRHRKPYA
jgi:hypothetical protein